MRGLKSGRLSVLAENAPGIFDASVNSNDPESLSDTTYLSFNPRHSHGKSRLRFGMRLYSENVRNAAMHMSEDNQQLVWFKNQAAKYQKKTKALEETLSLVNMAFLYFGPGARNKKSDNNNEEFERGIFEMFSNLLETMSEKDFLKKKAKGKESNDIVSDPPTSPAVKRSGAKALA
ncbi:hypothetical protein RND71_023495 [Anisodus tanguticus]|uniref:Uncharacterized protein n=1 Tax=Anisodus tanguticus TaxID=243964 RepID=A0AAE1RUH8_9SOLA|nr:hypothetical protein RND71_023495 [Anisodus tanguticus]